MSNISYSGAVINAYECNDVEALPNDVLVTDMDFGDQKTAHGIILSSDNGKVHGIRPRWAKVYKIGSLVQDVSIGEWILVAHGRWTRSVPVRINGETIVFRKVERKSILIVTDDKPLDIMLGDEFNMNPDKFKPEDFQQ